MLRLSTWAALLTLAATLAGCDDPFVASFELPEPEALLAEYGDLAPGTFAFRRFTSEDDPGQRFEGTAGYRPAGLDSTLSLCMRHELGGAVIRGRTRVADLRPGFRLDSIGFLASSEFSGESVLLVTNTSGQRIAGVFAAKMRDLSTVGGPEPYTSVVEGGFSAAYDSTLDGCP